MKRLHRSITAILARARLAIENFLKETILQTFLAEYGYDIARKLFKKGTEEHDALGLVGLRKNDFSGWYEQAVYFYKNALEHPGILEKLVLYNITVEKLQAGLQLEQPGGQVLLDNNGAQQDLTPVS